MADYYSLISRAVSALPSSSAEAREAVYVRARTALVSQLKNIQPPIGEADIRAESRALEEAITRIELEIASKTAAPRTSPPSAATSAPPAPRQAPAATGAGKTLAAPSAALARLRERHRQKCGTLSR